MRYAASGGTSRFPLTPSTGPLTRTDASRLLCALGFDRQNEAVEGLDAFALAGTQLLAAGRARLPELAVDEDEAVPPDLADGAGDQLRAHLDRLMPHLPRFADRERPDCSERDRDADHQWLRRVVRRRRVLEEHDRADREA